MTDTENLVLEQLRAIRNDIATFKQQTQENFHLVNEHVSALEKHVAALISQLPPYQ